LEKVCFDKKKLNKETYLHSERQRCSTQIIHVQCTKV
jgi:hypothetical protein